MLQRQRRRKFASSLVAGLGRNTDRFQQRIGEKTAGKIVLLLGNAFDDGYRPHLRLIAQEIKSTMVNFMHIQLLRHLNRIRQLEYRITEFELTRDDQRIQLGREPSRDKASPDPESVPDRAGLWSRQIRLLPLRRPLLNIKLFLYRTERMCLPASAQQLQVEVCLLYTSDACNSHQAAGRRASQSTGMEDFHDYTNHRDASSLENSPVRDL